MRIAIPRRPLVTMAAAALAVSGACTSFQDPSTVTDLRVLAVSTEPAEVILAVRSPQEAATVSVPDIAVTPLVADPAGSGRPLTLTVTACANDPSAASPPSNGDDPTGFPAGGARITVGSALCDGAPTELPIAAEVPLAAQPGTSPVPVIARLPGTWLADAFMRDVFPYADGRIHGGFDLGMPVVFQVTVRADAQAAPVKAIKRVTFWLQPLRADQVANESPVVTNVRAYARRDEATAEPLPDATVSLEAGVPLEVPAGGMWIDPVPADAPPYVTAVIDRLTGEVVPHDVAQETIRYSFYATAGTFSPFETSSQPPPGVAVSTRVHIESKYEPPPAAQRPAGTPLEVTIWIVARDERGGASWVTRSLVVPP